MPPWQYPAAARKKERAAAERDKAKANSYKARLPGICHLSQVTMALNSHRSFVWFLLFLSSHSGKSFGGVRFPESCLQQQISLSSCAQAVSAQPSQVSCFSFSFRIHMMAPSLCILQFKKKKSILSMDSWYLMGLRRNGRISRCWVGSITRLACQQADLFPGK